MPPVVTSEDGIKAGPPQPKDLRTAEQIAMTRHVDNYRIREDEDPESPAAEIDLGDLKLPKSGKATHALLQEVLSVEPANPDEEKVKRAKLQKIRAHLIELEQGAPTPVIRMADHKAITAAQSAHAVALRLEDLARVHPEVKALVAECDKLNAERGTRNAEMPQELLAEKLYGVYCVAVGGKAFNGDALPAWKDFAADEKKKVQAEAWRAVALAAKQLLVA